MASSILERLDFCVRTTVGGSDVAIDRWIVAWGFLIRIDQWKITVSIVAVWLGFPNYMRCNQAI